MRGDTARQVADLRAQGEFEKGDAILDLTQSYLTQLVELEKWGAEFNLDVDKFNTQIAQWNAEFELAVSEIMGSYQDTPTLDYLKYQTARNQWAQQFQTDKEQWEQEFQTSKDQWAQEFGYTIRTGEQDALIAAGLAALSVGVRPSASQQAAMGYTNEQIEAQLSAYQQAQSAKSYSGSAPKIEEKAPSVKTDPLGHLAYYGVDNAELAVAILSQTYDVPYAIALAEQYAEIYLTKSAAMREQETLQKQYGDSFTQALAWANAMLNENKSSEEIESSLEQFGSNSLNSDGVKVILQFIEEKRAGEV